MYYEWSLIEMNRNNKLPFVVNTKRNFIVDRIQHQSRTLELLFLNAHGNY